MARLSQIWEFGSYSHIVVISSTSDLTIHCQTQSLNTGKCPNRPPRQPLPVFIFSVTQASLPTSRQSCPQTKLAAYATPREASRCLSFLQIPTSVIRNRRGKEASFPTRSETSLFQSERCTPVFDAGCSRSQYGFQVSSLPGQSVVSYDLLHSSQADNNAVRRRKPMQTVSCACFPVE